MVKSDYGSPDVAQAIVDLTICQYQRESLPRSKNRGILSTLYRSHEAYYWSVIESACSNDSEAKRMLAQCTDYYQKAKLKFRNRDIQPVDNRLKDEWVEAAKSASIVSVLEAHGCQVNRHKTLCPFHSEKTPSFHVYEDSQRFHCFSCNEGGDVIDLYQRLNQCNFPQAVLALRDY